MQRQRAGVRPSPVAAVVVVRDVRVGPCPASQPAAATCAPHWPPLAGDWLQPLPFRRHPQADDATAVQCRLHVCTSCNRCARNSSSRVATAALTARAWTASRSGSTAAVLPCIVPATGGARLPCSPRLTIRQRSNATASRCHPHRVLEAAVAGVVKRGQCHCSLACGGSTDRTTDEAPRRRLLFGCVRRCLPPRRSPGRRQHAGTLRAATQLAPPLMRSVGPGRAPFGLHWPTRARLT